MLILFTYKLLKGYLTCLKLNQFGFRWMCSRRILGDIAPRAARALERAFTGRAVTREYTEPRPIRYTRARSYRGSRRYLDKHATYRYSATVDLWSSKSERKISNFEDVTSISDVSN